MISRNNFFSPSCPLLCHDKLRNDFIIILGKKLMKSFVEHSVLFRLMLLTTCDWPRFCANIQLGYNLLNARSTYEHENISSCRRLCYSLHMLIQREKKSAIKILSTVSIGTMNLNQLFFFLFVCCLCVFIFFFFKHNTKNANPKFQFVFGPRCRNCVFLV